MAKQIKASDIKSQSDFIDAAKSILTGNATVVDETPSAAEQAETMRIVTGSRKATVTHERREADGSLTVLDSATSEAPAMQPLPKSTRGTNGTTKKGKTVAKKTGKPSDDVSVADIAAKRAAKKPAASKKPTATKSTLSTLKSAAKPTEKKSAAAKKPAAARSTERPYVSRERKSRVTGTVVQLLDLGAADATIMPKNDMTWARLCVDHNTIEHHKTRAVARAGAADPSTWCKKCAKLVTKK